MIRRLLSVVALAALCGGFAGAATPAPAAPHPARGIDTEAEHLFSLARAAWRKRNDPTYIGYGALVRYQAHGKTYDDWWDAMFRTSDARLELRYIAVPANDARRLRGVNIGFLGFSNSDDDPIHVEQPMIGPTFSFGVSARGGAISNEPTLPSIPQAGETALPEIGRVTSTARDYNVTLVGRETLRYGPALHLHLTPLRDPLIYRLRDLWITPDTYATMQVVVQGIFTGKPYDGVPWTVTYVPIDGHWLLQQIKTDEPLHFGIGTTVSEMEFNFVDYHFPTEVPRFTFDAPMYDYTTPAPLQH